MPNGYQIIEPSGLGVLLGKPWHFDFAVAVLTWLIAEVKIALSDRLAEVDIEIIRVAYSGSGYPSIGVKYKSPRPLDLGPLIESTINRLLREKAAYDVIVGVANRPTSWSGKRKRVASNYGLFRLFEALGGGFFFTGLPRERCRPAGNSPLASSIPTRRIRSHHRLFAKLKQPGYDWI